MQATGDVEWTERETKTRLPAWDRSPRLAKTTQPFFAIGTNWEVPAITTKTPCFSGFFLRRSAWQSGGDLGMSSLRISSLFGIFLVLRVKDPRRLLLSYAMQAPAGDPAGSAGHRGGGVVVRQKTCQAILFRTSVPPAGMRAPKPGKMRRWEGRVEWRGTCKAMGKQAMAGGSVQGRGCATACRC